MQFVWTLSRKVTREKVPRGKLAGRDDEEEDDDEGEDGDEGEVGDEDVSGDADCVSLEVGESLFGH